MQWYFALKGQPLPKLSSDLVDCDQCQVKAPHRGEFQYSPENKCCEFSPFVSAFAVGALIEKNVDFPALISESMGDLILTKLGLLHGQKHRSTPASLCRYFDTEKRHCRIWWHRPPTCYSFFCVTEKTKQWQGFEMQLLEDETRWLKQWFKTLNLSEDLWSEWGLYMEPEPLVELPEGLKLSSWEKARLLYLESLNWLRDQC